MDGKDILEKGTREEGPVTRPSAGAVTASLTLTADSENFLNSRFVPVLSLDEFVEGALNRPAVLECTAMIHDNRERMAKLLKGWRNGVV